MISMLRIDLVEAKKLEDKPYQEKTLNVETKDLSFKEFEIAIPYTYTVEFKPDVGKIKMEGVVEFRLGESKVKEVKEQYEKTKRLPTELVEELINAVNYACGTTGILVTKAIGLPVPIDPPRIHVEEPKSEPPQAQQTKKGKPKPAS